MLLSVEGCGHLWELDVCGWVEVICGCSMFVGGVVVINGRGLSVWCPICGHLWLSVGGSHVHLYVSSYGCLWAVMVMCGGVVFICVWAVVVCGDS